MASASLLSGVSSLGWRYPRRNGRTGLPDAAATDSFRIDIRHRSFLRVSSTILNHVSRLSSPNLHTMQDARVGARHCRNLPRSARPSHPQSQCSSRHHRGNASPFLCRLSCSAPSHAQSDASRQRPSTAMMPTEAITRNASPLPRGSSGLPEALRRPIRHQPHRDVRIDRGVVLLVGEPPHPPAQLPLHRLVRKIVRQVDHLIRIRSQIV